MINSEIPSLRDVPSFQDLPNVTINHEATAELESTNAFEGPEKLLEVWFAPAADDLPAGVQRDGLKNVHEDTWKEMLDLVNCKILSVIKSVQVDAYLLSESSMFVFPHKLILKTCGTTTLLLGISMLLNIAAIHAGFPWNNIYLTNTPTLATPYRVFYSRKNFLFPDKQHGPHRSWKSEVEFLDQMFGSGSAYMVGKMNGDHWYLYLTTPNTSLIPPRISDFDKTMVTETKILNFPTDSTHSLSPGRYDDETLEVLMTDLDVDNAKQFYLEHANKVALDNYSIKSHEAQERILNCTEKLNGHLTSSVSGDETNSDVDLCEQTLKVSDRGILANGLITPPEDGYKENEIMEGHTLGSIISEACGLSNIYPASKYPNARIDAYLFSPCGFSANGVVPASDDSRTHYFTVHVTPEPHCSYASFESNVPARQSGRDTLAVVEDVVNIFKPGRFSVTLFQARLGSYLEPRDSDIFEGTLMESAQADKSKRFNTDKVKGYRRIDRIVHELDGYDLVFCYYEREDWRGGSPRLGEIEF